MSTKPNTRSNPPNSAADGTTTQPTPGQTVTDRLPFGDGADPGLAAAAQELRDGLIESYGAETATKRILVDGATASYYLQQKLAHWTATIMNSVDRDLFGRGSISIQQLIAGDTSFALERVRQQMDLQERANRQLARYVKGLRDEIDNTTPASGKERRDRR